MKPTRWRQHADRAADALVKACPDWGEVENLAHQLQRTALDLKKTPTESSPSAADILQWISTNLYTIHDEAVK